LEFGDDLKPCRYSKWLMIPPSGMIGEFILHIKSQ
jgi:hypothetical protein